MVALERLDPPRASCKSQTVIATESCQASVDVKDRQMSFADSVLNCASVGTCYNGGAFSTSQVPPNPLAVGTHNVSMIATASDSQTLASYGIPGSTFCVARVTVLPPSTVLSSFV